MCRPSTSSALLPVSVCHRAYNARTKWHKKLNPQNFLCLRMSNGSPVYYGQTRSQTDRLMKVSVWWHSLSDVWHKNENIAGWPNKNRTFWDTMFFSANADQFSKFFHQVIRQKSLHHKDFHFTCNMLQHYLVKVSKIQKMLLTLTAPQQTVDMFLRTLWGLDLIFNSS